MKNNDVTKYENFMKEFSELFKKYNLDYVIDDDETLTIYDKKTDKKMITCFDMDCDDFSTSGFYVDNDNSRTFISYEIEENK